MILELTHILLILWSLLDSSKGPLVAPYYVRLDDGTAVFNVESFFEKLNEPTLEVLFEEGSRVECKLGKDSNEWVPGLVLQSVSGFIELDLPPYTIEFDYGSIKNFYGPPNCIRQGQPKSDASMKKLRFKVGDRVECSMWTGFVPGTVVETNYREEHFETGHTVPYQVQLDTGEFIYAPMDTDIAIRSSSVPPPSCWICFDDKQTEDNLLVRECACKGTNGFVHVQCIVKLAKSKANFDIEPQGDQDLFPFVGCITCRQPFAVDSHCSKALSAMFYTVTRDLGISNTWNKMATTGMCNSLIKCEDYDRAKSILLERISLIREKIKDEALGVRLD